MTLLAVSKVPDAVRAAPRSEYREFRVASDGEVQGVGLMLAQDPSSRRLLVLAPLAGSPAARAGVLPGDEVRPRLLLRPHPSSHCTPHFLPPERWCCSATGRASRCSPQRVTQQSQQLTVALGRFLATRCCRRRSSVVVTYLLTKAEARGPHAGMLRSPNVRINNSPACRIRGILNVNSVRTSKTGIKSPQFMTRRRIEASRLRAPGGVPSFGCAGLSASGDVAVSWPGD